MDAEVEATVRNTEMDRLAGLVGEWTVTLSDAWFLEPPGTEVPGTATVRWLGESLLVWHIELHGHEASEMSWVIGRSDPNDRFVVLYQDNRGVCREFAMTFRDGRLEMSREDPDFHQRLTGEVERDRMILRPEASEDEGKTWRKDFDLTFVRA